MCCAMGEWRAWRPFSPYDYARPSFYGFRAQLNKDGVAFEGVVGMHDIDQTTNATTTPTTTIDIHEYAEVDGNVLKFESGEGPLFDDLTKQELPEFLVKATRRNRMDHVEGNTEVSSTCVRGLER